MTLTETEPMPSGIGPGRDRPKYAGTDDRCAYRDYENVRCVEAATDTVRGELYCGPHADLMAGI